MVWAAVAVLAAAAVPRNGTAAETPQVRDGKNHWAFQPLHRPEVPDSAARRAGGNPVDRFLAERLAKAGLRVSGEADRATLIRRVAFVVTGLPPGPEEIEAFQRDRSEGAYGRMVDRYLASPRYGERWGKHWLDAAGYADSNGYFNADTDRPLAFRYRDYVIRALNADRPFDRFIREQLAGDELAGWRPGGPASPEVVELLEATHYLRNGQDGSGESDGNPDEVRADRYYALESAMQIVGSSLLGVTVQCAKCHDHKFEPFSQREYYQLQAFLYPAFHIEKWVKPNDRVVEARVPGEREAWEAREKDLDARQAALLREFRAWDAENRPRGRVLFTDGFDDGEGFADRWSVTAPGDDAPGGTPAVSIGGAAAPAAQVRDGVFRILESGAPGDRWVSTRAAFPWEPARVGEWIQATFDLVSARAEAGGRDADRVGYFIALHDFDDSGPVAGGNLLVDGNPGGPTRLHLDYPGQDEQARGSIGATGYQPGHNYGVRVTRTGPDELQLEHLVDGASDGASVTLKPGDLPPGGFGFEYCCGRSFTVDNIAIEASKDGDPAWVERDARFRSEQARRRKQFEEAAAALGRERTPKPGRIAWMSDVVPEPAPVPLLKRGNPKTPGEPVEAGFPAFLSPARAGVFRAAGGQAAGTTGLRLAWARWLTEPGSAQAGLLARVTVNRLWQHYFGAGIVATPDNLGLSGAPPSHPELLEWLASEFVDSGWSLKAIHRVVLDSAAFRASSVATGRARELDPENRLLGRFPVRRLDAEAIRDAMLAAGGRLGPKSGGPYVPTQRSPEGEVVVDEARDDAHSRSLFLQQRRTQVASFLALFDAPAIVFNCTRRTATTQPLQSLGLLNSGFSVRRGVDLAERLQREAGEDEGARIRRGFLLVTGRPPARAELRLSRAFLAGQRRAYAGNPDAERRAWADFGQSLFALNAFLYLE